MAPPIRLFGSAAIDDGFFLDSIPAHEREMIAKHEGYVGADGGFPILCSGESVIALHHSAPLGDGWIATISVTTPEQLARLRHQTGRDKVPFSVYWTPMADRQNELLFRHRRYVRF